MDIVPYVMSLESAVFLVSAALVSIGGALVGLTAKTALRRRIGIWMLLAVGVCLALFSGMWLVAMYVPGGASVYEARQIVLLACVVACVASFLGAYLVSRQAKKLG